MLNAIGPMLARARRILFGPLPFLPRRRRARDVIDASDLPEGLRQMVMRIVRRTRLWRSERVEVARELCAHFRDGFEDGASEAELRDSFGDERASARMIRRAKKRNRPWAWHVWKRSWQGAGALVGLMIVTYGWLALRLYTAEPTITVDYLAKLNAPALAAPEEERGWTFMKQAMVLRTEAAEDGFEPDQEFTDSDGRIVTRRTALRPWHDQWPLALEYLDQQADGLDLVRRSLDATEFGFVVSHDPDLEIAREINQEGTNPTHGEALYEILLPHLGHARNSALLFELDSWRAVKEGNGAHVVQNLGYMLRLADVARDPPFVISQLVAFAMVEKAFLHVSELLEHGPDLFSDADLQRLAHLFATVLGGGDLRISLDLERATFDDLLQRTYTDDGHGNGVMTAAGLRLMREIRSWGLMENNLFEDAPRVFAPIETGLAGDRKSMRELVDRYFALVEREGSTPLWKRAGFESDEMIDAYAASPSMQARYPLFSVLPKLARATAGAEITTLRRDGLLVAIALELFNRRHEHYPWALDDLVPELLPRVPIDRFDGKPVRYCQRDDGTPVVYSIGSDLDDDGGIAPGEGWRGIRVRRVEPLKWFGSREEVERLKRETPNRIPDGDWILWSPSVREMSDEEEE